VTIVLILQKKWSSSKANNFLVITLFCYLQSS
jgi:hypothetical protein